MSVTCEMKNCMTQSRNFPFPEYQFIALISSQLPRFVKAITRAQAPIWNNASTRENCGPRGSPRPVNCRAARTHQFRHSHWSQPQKERAPLGLSLAFTSEKVIFWGHCMKEFVKHWLTVQWGPTSSCTAIAASRWKGRAPLAAATRPSPARGMLALASVEYCQEIHSPEWPWSCRIRWSSCLCTPRLVEGQRAPAGIANRLTAFVTLSQTRSKEFLLVCLD